MFIISASEEIKSDELPFTKTSIVRFLIRIFAHDFVEVFFLWLHDAHETEQHEIGIVWANGKLTQILVQISKNDH